MENVLKGDFKEIISARSKFFAFDFPQILPSLNYLETLDFGDCLCRNAGVDAIMANLDPVKHPSLKVYFLFIDPLVLFIILVLDSESCVPCGCFLKTIWCFGRKQKV